MKTKELTEKWIDEAIEHIINISEYETEYFRASICFNARTGTYYTKTGITAPLTSKAWPTFCNSDSDVEIDEITIYTQKAWEIDSYFLDSPIITEWLMLEFREMVKNDLRMEILDNRSFYTNPRDLFNLNSTTWSIQKYSLHLS